MGGPRKLMADYYSVRTEAGLIITEATAINFQGHGWLNAPGIWTDTQEKGWKVTDAIHAKGGHILLQLWHMGRAFHPDFFSNTLFKRTFHTSKNFFFYLFSR